MPPATLELGRGHILAFRRRVGALDSRLSRRAASLRQAAWAGLQDSMPRAALLSLNARIDATESATLWDRSLVQIWGPRFSVYVVPRKDVALFTLGRIPDDPKARTVAVNLASRIDAFLDGRAMRFGDVGRALGEPPNRLRYATTTGSVVLYWDGARQPKIRTVPPPDIDPVEARNELARRYLHVFGPATAGSFSGWAGIKIARAVATFHGLKDSLTWVSTPIGGGWILSSDEEAIRAQPVPSSEVRLLPSGDPYYLLWGDDRDLVVPHPVQRGELWTSRVWPGAVLADGEIVGTWRRSRNRVSVTAWTRLRGRLRERIEAEAAALPLSLDGAVTVDWMDP